MKPEQWDRWPTWFKAAYVVCVVGSIVFTVAILFTWWLGIVP